ncbi:MFS transporter [Niveispirillum sp.]|uniref:MFS transporter n=1 Tax=Niveispirillum sp. TaxID=1917217 RepID=UPI001B65C244|nr:MFS transporter [Niveispirillum sp.]MBP7339467.1 MFS transporter [Niveispirillum sp.]
MRMHAFVRVALSMTLILAMAAGLFLTLGMLEYRRSLILLLSEQGGVAARSVRGTLERNMALGLSLASLPNTDTILARAVVKQATVQGVLLLDGAGIEVLGRSADRLGRGDLPAGWTPDAAGGLREVEGQLLLSAPIRNSFDQVEGNLVLLLDEATVSRRTWDMARQLGVQVAMATGVAVLALIAVLMLLFWRLRAGGHADPGTFLTRAIGALAAGMLLLCLALGLWRATQLFEADLLPELDRTAQAVLNAVSNDFSHAVSLGVPFDKLGGVEEYLSATRDDEPQITLLAVTDAAGRLRHAVGADGAVIQSVLDAWVPGAYGLLGEMGGNRVVAESIQAADSVVGTLFVGADAGFVRGRLADILLDVGMVVVVALIVTMEVTRFLIGTVVTGIAAPIAQRRAARTLALVRLGFFLLIFADAFTYSFMPVYARSLLGAGGGLLNTATAVGLPISAFWLAVAVAQPLTGLVAHRLPRSALLAAVAGLAAAGLLLCGTAGGLPALLAGRVIGGLAIGAVMILVQDSILAAMPVDRRTQANAIYLSIFFGGTVCGTLTGSLIADHAGPAATLIAASALALLAVPCLLSSGSTAAVRTETTGTASVAEPRRLSALSSLLRNRRFMSIVLLAAVPSRLMITGFLYYLAPLRLADLGNSPSETGRVMMIYSLLMALTAPGWGRLVDGRGGARRFVLASGVLTAATALLALSMPTTIGLVLAVMVLGTAQAFGMSSQITLIFEETEAERARAGRLLVLSVYRVADRVGLFIGPVVMAALLGLGGLDAALTSIGVLCLGTTVLLALGLRLIPRSPV